MPYTLQSGAPTITANGRTFALGAFIENSPVGGVFMVGVFENATGMWSLVGNGNFVFENLADNSILTPIQAAGGIVNFNAGLKAAFNKVLAAIFSAAPSPTPAPSGEPVDFATASGDIVTFVNGLKITFVNGQLQV
jgi:hypothetical protein